MTEIAKKFSILITTKNRVKDLAFTLEKLNNILLREDVECIICDDSSTDDTVSFLHSNYPNIQLIKNEKSKGLIFNRNRLMSLVNGEYAISIDDDLHFVTHNPLEIIEEAFSVNPKIGLYSFRIYWNIEEPHITACDDISFRMKSFAGGANVWRISAWRDIPDYPAWFVFYGEEDFASYHLFKKGWEIHYLPDVLVNHRVDIKARKKEADYSLRLQRSLRSGWYLYFLFYPLVLIPKKFLYTVWIQIRTKVLKGDFRALKAIFLALVNVLLSIPKIIRNANRLTIDEYREYQKLGETKLYWTPKVKKSS